MILSITRQLPLAIANPSLASRSPLAPFAPLRFRSGFLQRGVVVEEGGYDELFARGGVFTSLVALQGGPTVGRSTAGGASQAGDKASSVERIREEATPGTSVGQLAISVEGTSVGGATGKGMGKAGVDVTDRKGKDAATVAAAPSIPLGRLAALSFPETGFFAIGTIAALGNGAIFPCFAIIFGSLLQVRDKGEVGLLFCSPPFFLTIPPFFPVGPLLVCLF